MACGTKALDILKDKGAVPKGRAITSLRGKPVVLNGVPYLITYDPSLVDREYDKLSAIQWDCALAKRLFATGKVEPQVPLYNHGHDFDEAVYYLKGRMELFPDDVIPIVFDLETMGLDPYEPGKKIVSISLTWKRTRATVIHFSVTEQPGECELVYKDGQVVDWGVKPLNVELGHQIQWLLNHPQLRTRGANFKFDLSWIWRHWALECTNFSFDTTLVGSLLDENRSNSLNLHAKLFTDIGGYDDAFNAKFNKSKMEAVPLQDLIPYAGGDTDACYRTATRFVSQLAPQPGLVNFYVNLLHPAARAMEKMENTGIVADVEYYETLGHTLRGDMQKVDDQVWDMLPGRLQSKYRGDWGIKPSVIKDFLFSPRGLNLEPQMYTASAGDDKPYEKAATSADHMKLIAQAYPDARPFIDLVGEKSLLQKTHSTYIVGFMKHLRADGRWHPTAILHRGVTQAGEDSGTVTGRLAFKDPAVQTIPKHTKYAKALRRGLIAPPGYVIINWDYSQGELRITACVAGEEVMIAAYKGGFDLHALTGGSLNGYTVIEMEQLATVDPELYARIRQGGKAGNFGLIYGMSPMGYVHYAYNTYGVILTEEEGHNQHNLFFETYPGLSPWHGKSKNEAHNTKQIISPLGRIRHLPMIDSFDYKVRAAAERQAINAPVQSTLSDMSLKSLSEFDAEYSPNAVEWHPECQFFLMTHDAVTAYVKEDKVDIWLPRVREIMENLPLEEEFGWTPQLDFPVDAEIGFNMADMTKAAA